MLRSFALIMDPATALCWHYFEPSSHPLSLPSLALFCQSGQIPSSQHQAVSANPSPSQRHSQSPSQSPQPPPVTPSLPILVNHPNQKALITAVGFPWSTCQKEGDREWKNSTIVPQRLMGLLCGPIWFSNSPGIVVWCSPGASTGWSLTREEARSVLACGWRAGDVRLMDGKWKRQEERGGSRDCSKQHAAWEQWGYALPCSWVWVIPYGAGASLRDLLLMGRACSS